MAGKSSASETEAAVHGGTGRNNVSSSGGVIGDLGSRSKMCRRRPRAAPTAAMACTRGGAAGVVGRRDGGRR